MIDEARKIAFRVLSCSDKGSRVDDSLHHTLAHTPLDSRERRLTTELVIDSTRMKRQDTTHRQQLAPLSESGDLNPEVHPSSPDYFTSTETAAALLELAIWYLRPGAILIYATCSLETEENWDLIRKFQEQHPDTYMSPMPSDVPPSWLDDNGALQTFPSNHHVDGVYAVCLQVS
jgi:16S rRNA (cytosine967-C5)-methyltransferase